MTHAFVLLGETDHEGDTLLGVYTSYEAADAAYAQYTIDHTAFDDYRIVQVEVGAAADWYW
jgi:hypothetical protein